MTALVPERASFPSEAGIFSGAPVRGRAWEQMAKAANYLLGRGSTLIPWTALGRISPSESPMTWRFTIWPRYQATHRLWIFTFNDAPFAGESLQVLFTPPSGTMMGTFTSGGKPTTFVEPITSRVTGETQISFSLIVNAGGFDDAEFFVKCTCIEVPRPELVTGGSEYGVEPASLAGKNAIYDGDGNGLSLVSVVDATAQALLINRRTLFQFAVPENGGGGLDENALSWNGSSYVDLLSFSQPLLDRQLYRSQTLAGAAIRVFTRSASGTTGDVKFTMTNGATTTISISAADAGTWRSGTINVDVENLAADDGRRSTRWDKCLIQGRRLTGAGTLWLESVSIAGLGT